MNILQIHNRYREPGGEDVVVKAESDLLTSKGHSVHLYEESNEKIKYKLEVAASAIYSLKSKRKVYEIIQNFKPQIVHVHNLFPIISPSVYSVCNDLAIPVIQTIHNYRLICLNGLFYREKHICEDCVGHAVPWPGVKHGCYRNSHAQSIAVASMLSVHRALGTWKNQVDRYICMTEFQKSKIVLAGIPESKISVKPNFSPDPGANRTINALGDYILYAGRLSEEKGIEILIRAYTENDVKVPLIVAGDGPSRNAIEVSVRQSGLENIIKLVGYKNRVEMIGLMKGARFLVFPSQLYEGFPVTIAEAFSCSLPVMASHIGTASEIVTDNETGWSISSNSSDVWANAIKKAWECSGEIVSLRHSARKAYEKYYSPEVNYRKLINIYNMATGKP